MKQKYTKLIAAILVAVFFSCSKDKGNYEYHEVNRVVVKTKDSVFSVQQLQSLKIVTTLEQTTAAGGGPYTYEWHIYPKVPTASLSGVDKGEEKPVLLSTTKDLDANITLPPNDYFLRFTVTDQTSGIKTFKIYSVTVNGAFYEGWLVLSNKDQKAVLSFIRKDNQVFKDPVKEINNLDLSGKGLAVYSGVITMMSDVYVFTNQDVYRLRANDFVLTATGKNMFNTPPASTNPYYTINYINTDQYIIDNGNIYATISPYFGAPGKYSETFGGLDYKAFPYYFSGSKFYACFYDNKNKRFMQTSYNSRTVYVFGTMSGASYDLNNVGKTMIAADRGVQNEFYTIMKDNTGYFYYSFLPNLAVPAGVAQRIQDSPEIEQATTFAASGTLQQMYYAANNRVYVYDIMANRSRVVYEFPANTKVKDIEMYKGKGWGKFTDPMFNRRLVVATYNGTEGEVYYLDLTSTGDVDKNTYSQKFGGFADIVQINYRNPNE